MPPRQTTAWFIVDRAPDRDMIAAVRRLPPGTGLLLLGSAADAGLLRLARTRRRSVISEKSGQAARVHTVRELRRALLRRTPLIFLSPLYPTATHPTWRPIPRMRAAALARLANRRLLALGGMDARRFARVKRLGFRGWAGISAWSGR